jgi:hypothetical protein
MATETYLNVRKNNFTMVGNELLNDKALTLQAKGLLSIFISNDTDKFKINMKEIISRSKNGRDAQYKIVDELIKHGYFARVEIREGGKFVQMIYLFSDNKADVAEALKKYVNDENAIINPDKKKKKAEKAPVPENQDTVKKPLPENQDTEFQYTENADTENQDINNTNLNYTNSNNTKSNNTNLSIKEDQASERVIKAVQDNLENLAIKNVDTDILCKWIVENASIVSEEEQVRVITGLATWGEKINNTNKVIGYILRTKSTPTRTEMLPEWLNTQNTETPVTDETEQSMDNWEAVKAQMEAELKALDAELKGGNN